jgi:hypothetical protein
MRAYEIRSVDLALQFWGVTRPRRRPWWRIWEWRR